ncbi:MAG: ABC transporter permease [Verrucomicrobia bacterium]|nr:ABC transporter permease [Verrucomicrobiota bacterium]
MKTPSEQAWISNWLESVWHDVRFSLRSLRRSPAFTATVVATLALCIGANTAIISVLYGLVLKPLPYPHPEQIVDVYNMRPKAGQMHLGVGAAQYLDYKANADLFSDFALWRGWMFNIGEDGGTARYVGMIITSEYFSVVGVRPLMGRFFTPEECEPGKSNVTVLMQSYWEKHFNADPAIVGKEVRLSGKLCTIVGVAPKSFEELSVAPNLVVPMEFRPEQKNPQWRVSNMGSLYARIKPGVTHGAALAQLAALEQRFLGTVASPQVRDFLTSGGHRMGLEQVREQQTTPVRSGLLMLQGGALLVLLLGCVNVASLMLARANTRQAEFAVRAALGAGRGVLARQPLIESVLLALAGSALGLALAWGSLRVINVYMDKIVFGIPPVRVDAGVLGLTLLVAFVVALLIGLLPMVRVWRAHSLQGGLQSGTRGASRGGGIRAMSSVLVVAQVAFALMLLIGAGLLMRSFAKVMAINPGFDAKQVIHVRVAYDAVNFKDDAAIQGLQQRLLEKMRQIPGVELVAYTSGQPGFSDQTMTLPILGRPAGNDSVAPTAVVFGVSPEYFPTMGIRLIEGRLFTEVDQLLKARPATIVDRRFAERYFPGRSPVGQIFAFGPPDAKPETLPIIVGVVEVARVRGLEDPVNAPNVYWSIGSSYTSNGLSIELRTKRSFEEMMPLIRAQVRAVDPTLPIYGEKTMQMQLDDLAANRRGILWLLGAFAGLALILSAVGIYGMLAYDVTQRTKEIGIRGAIGASREQIVAMILKQGLFKAGLGLVIGLAGALVLSRFMEKLLYDVKPTDPVVFVVVATVLLAVALLASWLPARRAAKVDPMVALRYE